MPHRTGYVFKGRAHAHITRPRNGAISGYIIIISGHFVVAPGHCIISPWLFIMAFTGYYVGLTLGRGLSGGYMMRLAGRGIVDPVYSAISQRCFHNNNCYRTVRTVLGKPSQLDPRPSSHPFQRSRQTTGERRRRKSPPPISQTPKLPQKIRPRRRKREHYRQHLPGTNGNSPGIDLRPREMRQTPVKHPRPPQHPQQPRPAANENSSRVNLPDQDDHGRLYKQAPPSRVKDSTERSRRDYFSGSSPSFSSKQPHRDYFSGSSSHSRACKGPGTELSRQPRANKKRSLADPST